MRFLSKSTVVAAALAAVTTTASFVSAHAASDTSPRVHVVKIQNFKFVPATLTIRKGDTVTWINRDIAPHTATKEGKAWDTGKLTKDQSTKVTLSSPGTTSYFCRFHPNMHGELTVSVN